MLITLLSTLAIASPNLTVDALDLTLAPAGYDIDVTVRNQGSSTAGSFYVDVVSDGRAQGLWGSGYSVATVSPGGTFSWAHYALLKNNVYSQYISQGITDPVAIAGGLWGSGMSPVDVAISLLSAGFGDTDIASGLWGSGMSPTDIASGLWGSGMNVIEAAHAMDATSMSDTDIASGLWGSGMAPYDEAFTGAAAIGVSLDTMNSVVFGGAAASYYDDMDSEDYAYVGPLAPGASTTISLHVPCDAQCSFAATADALSQLDLWLTLDIEDNVAEYDETDNMLRIGFDGPASAANNQTLGLSQSTTWTQTVSTPAALQTVFAAFGVTLPTTLDVTDVHMPTLDL